MAVILLSTIRNTNTHLICCLGDLAGGRRNIHGAGAGHDSTKRNYLHPVAGSDAAKIGAELFPQADWQSLDFVVRLPENHFVRKGLFKAYESGMV